MSELISIQECSKCWQLLRLVDLICSCTLLCIQKTCIVDMVSYRDNVEDALEKLQAAVDGAVESIQPIEVDPEKEKQLKKQ